MSYAKLDSMRHLAKQRFGEFIIPFIYIRVFRNYKDIWQFLLHRPHNIMMLRNRVPPINIIAMPIFEQTTDNALHRSHTSYLRNYCIKSRYATHGKKH